MGKGAMPKHGEKGEENEKASAQPTFLI